MSLLKSAVVASGFVLLLLAGCDSSTVDSAGAVSSSGDAGTVDGANGELPPGAITSESGVLPPGITFLGGSMTYLDPPPISVRLGELKSDEHTFVFAEKQQVVLEQDISAEITEPGIWFSDQDQAPLPVNPPLVSSIALDLPRGTIPAGSVVDSYYLHFDNVSYEFGLYRYTSCFGQIGVLGQISFDRPIIGVIINPNLGTSGEQLGNDSTVYDDNPFSTTFPGLNLSNGCGSDQIIISDDRMTMIARNFTDIHHDNFRVLLGDPSVIQPSPLNRSP